MQHHTRYIAERAYYHATAYHPTMCELQSESYLGRGMVLGTSYGTRYSTESIMHTPASCIWHNLSTTISLFVRSKKSFFSIIMNYFCVWAWAERCDFSRQCAPLLFDWGKKSDSRFLFHCDCCEIDRSSGKCLMAETFEQKLDWFIKMLLFIGLALLIELLAFFAQFIVQCQSWHTTLKWLNKNSIPISYHFMNAWCNIPKAQN